jgi:hypothetical protein
MSLLTVGICYVTAVFTNYFIDRFGHKKVGKIAVRTSRTHSLTGILLTTVVSTCFLCVAVASGAALLPADSYNSLAPIANALHINVGTATIQTFLFNTVWCSLVSSAVHLFTDMTTESGVFFRKKRVRIAKFKYNGPINWAYMSAAAAFIIFTFCTP